MDEQQATGAQETPVPGAAAPAADLGGEQAETTVPVEPEQAPAKQEEDDEGDGLPKGVRRRIDRLTREKYEERAKAQALEMRLRDLEERAAQQAPRQTQAPEPQEPKREQFDDYEAWIEARAEWKAEQAFNRKLHEHQAQTMAARQRAAQEQMVRGWEERVVKAREELPDYDLKLQQNANIPLSQAAQAAIVNFDLGPQIAYHIATHPEDAAKLNSLDLLSQVKFIGRLEDRLSAAPPKPRQSSAPAPVDPVKGGAGRDPNELSDNLSTAEWTRRREAQLKAKRG